MFRIRHNTPTQDLTAYSPSWQTLGTWDMNDAFGGLASSLYEALTASASVTGASDQAITVRLTFTGIGVADKTYDVTIAASGTSGTYTIDESLLLTQYRYVTATAQHGAEPVSSATGLQVVLFTQYPPSTVEETEGGLFTLAEIVSARRPDSPIGTSVYWDDIRVAAEGIVKDITRRNLDDDTYTDKGELLEQELDCGLRYVWYLMEPTGSAIAYASFTTKTVDGTAVAVGDVIIEKDRLIFNAGGEVVLTYPGGWLRNATAKAVIRQAVIAAMHAIHSYAQKTGSPGGFGGEYYGPDFSAAKAMLAPYTMVVWRQYSQSPAED